MSTFGARTVYCPACGAGTERTVVVSLNGGRRPDLRRQILDGTFQRVVCPGCGAPHRLEEPFVYIDFDRKQWITCFPPAREAEWSSLESEPREDWKEAMITYAPPLVRAWSAGFTVRAVFGLAALREKLVCIDQGVHDIWLAVMQLDAMLQLPEVGFHASRRLRLVGVDGELLIHRIPGTDTSLAVPRGRLVGMQADPLAWSAAYEALGKGPYVDVGRILLAGGAWR
ncbi:MAG: CpXC domain-containing protein [Pseudomonadota bacterium]|nr:CpXC domain-containing protein [Pseudomonadota bacterium]